MFSILMLRQSKLARCSTSHPLTSIMRNSTSIYDRIRNYGINWFRDDESIRIEKEHLDEKRVIWLGASAVAVERGPASYVGISMGHFESDRHLIVETDGFLPTRWGNANGIDSSEHKRLIENYVLSEDGMAMEISYTIEDPEYLTEPVTVSGRYLKGPNRDFVEFGCDPESASRHLSVE